MVMLQKHSEYTQGFPILAKGRSNEQPSFLKWRRPKLEWESPVNTRGLTGNCPSQPFPRTAEQSGVREKRTSCKVPLIFPCLLVAEILFL